MKPSKAQRIPAPLLQKFAEGCYVDSPVYFNAPYWVRWMNWTKLDRLLAMGERGGSPRVLDFACGNGVMLPTWGSESRGAVGVDLHVTAADRVRKHYGLKKVRLAKAGGTSLPFLPSSFDLVFAASALEHFADLKNTLEEIHRVLRVGGQLLFLCPNENQWYGWGRRIAGYKKPPDHYHTADEVIAWVQSFFKIEAISCFPSWFPPAVSVYKMGRAKRI